MNPNLTTNTETETKKIKTGPNLKLILFILFILALGVGAYFYFSKGGFYFNQGKITYKNVYSTPTPTLSPRDRIEGTIKETFTSKDTIDVITYLNRASAEKEASRSYSLYKQTFTEMNKAYTKSKNITYKYAMIDLKTFLSTFSVYKQQDFVIPK